MPSDVSSSIYVTNDSVPSMSSYSGSISTIASTTTVSPETESTNVSTTRASESAPFLTRYSPVKPLQRVEKMSYAQSKLWFLIECLEDPTTYNCTVHYSLSGSLDATRLEQAILTAANKHEALRTLFFTDPETGDAKQGIMESPQFVWTHHQIGNEAEIGLEFQKMRNRVFDVKNGQTMAAVLLSRGHERHELVLGYHHIIMDGVSWQIFIREIASSYCGEKPVSSVAKQYVDFSNRQRELAKKDAFQRALKYYKAEFGEPPQPLPLLPFAKSGYRRILTCHDVQTYNQRIDSGCSAKVRQASSRAKSTPFHFHLGTLQVLLQRMLDVEDFCIGIADANRRDEEFENVVGLMVNVVPIRFKPKSEESFSSIIQHTRQHVLDALTHSPYLYHALMTNVENLKDTSYSPLYQVILNYIAGATYDIPLNDCKLEHTVSEEARHPQDLVVTVREDSDGTTFISFTAHKYLYSLKDIEGLMAIYINLVKTLSTDTSLQLDKCELFDDSARQRTIELGRGPDSDLAWPDTLSLRVVDIVHQTPEAPAVKDQKGTILTYAQMQARTYCIAESLHKGGVRQGMFVAVTCEPNTDTICSLLAIWLIGAIYVPLETYHGIKRLVNIVSDCKPAAIVCHNSEHIEIAHTLGLHQICDLSILPLSATFSFQDQSEAAAPAVLLYTSGSTGTPKGVLLSHANLKAQLLAVQNRFNLGKETVLQQSSMGFDASLFQIFSALANGGTLIMSSARSDPAKLAKLIMEEKVSLTLAVPTEYSLWIGSGIKYLSNCSSWRLAFCGGEKMTALTMQAFSRLSLPDLQLINAYGPTETTVACSMGRMEYRIKNSEDSSNNSVIGFPLSEYQVYVLDEHLRSLPVGWPGEICIGGAGVSAGYLNKDAETEKSFVRNPFTTDDDIEKGWTRLYRTGDRGQILEDGSINFIGRIDSDTQIKLRGIRIELDEVSNAIVRTSKGAIREAVVIKKGQVDPFLVAFVVVSKEFALPEPNAYLRRLLLSLPLPPYMRPAVALPLTKFPITTNGKINRSALDSIPLSQTRHPDEATDLTLTEKKLAEIWKDLLPEASKSFAIDKHSNFFAVGGNSILLLMLQARIRDIANLHILLPKLFQSTTLEEVALQVELRASIGNTTQAIDWALETSISDLLFEPTETAQKPIGPPKLVLLTGVTGFLGSAILNLLIDTASITTIHCVAVRTPTPKLEALSPKIVIHSGNLSHPTLNLSPSTLLSFTSTIDAIIHNGADVSFLKPFSSLRAPNVSSTKFLVRVAAPRRIPFHFISSAGVTRLSERSSFPEASVAANHPSNSHDGYTASKWAGEMVLERASAVLSLPVSLYRPTSIVGEGAPAKDVLANVLGSSRRMRAVPRLDGWSGWFDLVAVETVAKGVVNGVMRGNASNRPTEGGMVRFFHLCGEKRFEVSKLRQFVQEEVGQTVREIDLQEWVTQASTVGLDQLVAEYLCSLDKGKGGVMLPLLDCRE
jgi:amino acid adenylation domain-containing protein